MDTSTVQSEMLQPEVSQRTAPSGEISTAFSSSQQEFAVQWQQVIQSVFNFLSNFPDYISRFFKQNQKAIINVFFVLTLFIVLDVVLRVLDTLNHIPLVSTFLELIGLSYSLWFTNRYLLKAQDRQELMQKIRGTQREVSTSESHLLSAEMSS